MSNLLTAGLAYNPYFYVNEGLRILYKRLGMAFYVKRDLAAGKASGSGDTVQVRRAQTFTAQNMPIAVASYADVSPTYDNLKIGSWMGNGFKLTDKEKTLTPEVFVRDHLSPVANSIADQIDQNLSSLTLEVPARVAASTSPNCFKDFPNGRKALFDNKAPIVNANEYSYMVDGVLQQNYESDSVFVQAQSDASAGQLQRDGQLGTKWGFKVFANQNAVTYAGGSGTGGGTVTGVQAAGTSAVTVAAITGTIPKGSIATITTSSVARKYAVVADSTGTTLNINSQGLKVASVGGDTITYDQTARTSMGLMFHRDAFALVMQPLEDAGPGILSATVTEPVTGLTLRSRIGGDFGTGTTIWALDALWGYKTLNQDLAAAIVI